MSTKPLILLHGALGSSAQMAPLAEQMNSIRPVLLMDFEGHGHAPSPDRPLRTGHLARNILEFMDAHGLEHADLFGYSMGGYVALYLATIAPERVGRIATLGTKLAWTSAFAAGEVARLDPDAIEAKVPRFAALLAERHGPDRWRDLLGETAEMMTDLGASPLLNEETLSRVQQPVLVCRGVDDEMVTHEECVEALQHLPHAEMVELVNTPHAIERARLEAIVAPLEPWFGGD